MPNRVSIISTDHNIVIDGVGMKTDCAELLADQISAVQWEDGAGHIEFVRHVRPNEMIDDFSPFEKYVEAAYAPQPLNPPPVPVKMWILDQYGNPVEFKGG
jgi:hypothetical protein